MRVLVICDDVYHPARTARTGLAPLAEQGFEFDWVEHANEWSAEQMAQYPVVLFTKANNVSAAEKTPWMTPRIEQAFCEYVEAGNGLLVVHSGTAGYKDAPRLRELIGGLFVSHPPQLDVTVELQEGHKLTAGCEDFTQRDEHYFMDMSDPDAAVFARSVSDHGSQPAAWTRTSGSGRVCVLTSGHNVEVWLHPSFQTLLQNCLHWCRGVDTAAGA